MGRRKQRTRKRILGRPVLKKGDERKMPTLAEWKLIGITLFITFFISALLYGIIGEIITRMQNKTKRVTRKQSTHKYTKIDLCRNLVANMQQEFIGERKMIFNELVKM